VADSPVAIQVGNTVGAPCALFVKLTLRRAREGAAPPTDVPYAIFARNHFVLRPSELVQVAVEQGLQDCVSAAGCEVCAEAWNSKGALQCAHL
jgi:hypothetical protein